MLLVSKAKKRNPSFVITSDFKRQANNALEIIFYVIDLQDSCQVFIIKTKLIIESQDPIEIKKHNYGKNEKIVKEIIKVIDKNTSIFPW